MEQSLIRQINLKQTSANTYSVSWDPEWAVGTTLLGGTVTAQLYHAAETHLKTDPALVARNQPDVLSMHVEFLNVCDQAHSVITVTALKVGAIASTLQLNLTQKDKLKAMALVTSTNFDVAVGPSATTAWSLQPTPPPRPNLDNIFANKPDPNWLPVIVRGQVMPIIGRFIYLDPRRGFGPDGICDLWLGYNNGERIRGTQIAMMTDALPSMSDTLLRNNGLYDGHAIQQGAKDWADKNPGKPYIVTNTVEQAMKSETFYVTLTMDLEFNKRLPDDGARMVFIRTATQALDKGRLALDVTMCDEEKKPLCNVREMVFVLPAGRKFKPTSSSEKGRKEKAAL